MFKTASWLKNNLNNPNVKIIDASWYLPNSSRNNIKEYRLAHIPGAVFFDIDKICAQDCNLPHMIPDKKYFEYQVSKLGINKKNLIIVYCKEGIMSSPRVWWTFKYFGHKNIFVLNGGFRAWQLINGKIVGKKKANNKIGFYKCNRIIKKYLITYEDLVIKLESKKTKILDARPKERFLKLAPEPRENIGRGKIKNSLNFPHSLFDLRGYVRSKTSLRKTFKELLKEKGTLTCSCGSGISACVIAISLNYIGNNNWQVYDGSWTEWFINFKH